MSLDKISILNGGIAVLTVSFALAIWTLVKMKRHNFEFEDPATLSKTATFLTRIPAGINLITLILFLTAAGVQSEAAWLILFIDFIPFGISAAVCPPWELLGLVVSAVCMKKTGEIKQGIRRLILSALSFLVSSLFIYWVLWAIQ